MSSGLFQLGEIKDLAMSLSEILLLLEIDLKRPFNSHKCNATLRDREIKVISMRVHVHISKQGRLAL